MQTIFNDWPEVPWQQGWLLRSMPPENQTPFITASDGAVAVPGSGWELRLVDPDIPCSFRFFSNGMVLNSLKHADRHQVALFVTAPGVLCGMVRGFPSPQLITPDFPAGQSGEALVQEEAGATLLRIEGERFILVTGGFLPEFARIKAETALEETDVEMLLQQEKIQRQKIFELFSINPRHNPPVALAAETLAARLRGRNGALHGLWSAAEGFERETVSLNELFPLIRAWNLINPPIAQQLMQTVFSMQQSDGGFPAWMDAEGPVSTTAPWPLVAQSFEHVWLSGKDSAFLKKHLPALRKYVQWALRRFDPRRDGIPAWQSEQEAFVPGGFERGKATPEVSVLLIAEIEALLRLCGEDAADGTADSLKEERDHLLRTLNTIFWNPSEKDFSTAWKDGHYLRDPSFGAFMPLMLKSIHPGQRTALLETFEETGHLPGTAGPGLAREQEEIDETNLLPAIHQFFLFEIFRRTEEARALRVSLIYRAREGFAAWFERESIAAARHDRHAAGSAYALGPVTAALILAAQDEFEREAEKAPTSAQQILQWIHRLRLNKGDLKILLGLLAAIVTVRLVYSLPSSRQEGTRIAEAALNYRQGRYAEAVNVFQRYPENPLSCLLRANLMILSGQPDAAEPLYRTALRQQPGSPSALFGLALSLQMTGRFEEAEKRYGDFIDIHQASRTEVAGLAREFMLLSREKFSVPPRWRQVYVLPMMNDLGL